MTLHMPVPNINMSYCEINMPCNANNSININCHGIKLSMGGLYLVWQLVSNFLSLKVCVHQHVNWTYPELLKFNSRFHAQITVA
jgi:hypothetical protein